MGRVKYKIVVMSGKGGVGKSTVAVNLAWALAMRELQVGVLDADIHGPNLGKMLGAEAARFTGTEEEIEPVEVLPNLKAASVAMIGYDPDSALIWRGPMKLGIIKQFLGDIVWGDLDFLVIDTPPGTGDEPLSIAQIIPKITGAIVVTTPQDVALVSVRKSITFVNKLKIPVIGIIENMSGFTCPHCGKHVDIFKSGGGKKAAKDYQLSFLGSIPLDPTIVETGDSGTTTMIKDSTLTTSFETIAENVKNSIKEKEEK